MGGSCRLRPETEIGPTIEDVVATAAATIGRRHRFESPFDTLAAELLRRHAAAEVAFLPGVGFGVTLWPGPIMREQLYALLPHPARLATVSLTGAQTVGVLEQSTTNQRPSDPMDVVGGLIQTAEQ